VIAKCVDSLGKQGVLGMTHISMRKGFLFFNLFLFLIVVYPRECHDWVVDCLTYRTLGQLRQLVVE
jgi:hypothetical protein